MRVPATYQVEPWEPGQWAVVRDGIDLHDMRQSPRRRLTVLIVYADEYVAEQVALALNMQRAHELAHAKRPRDVAP